MGGRGSRDFRDFWKKIAAPQNSGKNYVTSVAFSDPPNFIEIFVEAPKFGKKFVAPQSPEKKWPLKIPEQNSWAPKNPLIPIPHIQSLTLYKKCTPNIMFVIMGANSAP